METRSKTRSKSRNNSRIQRDDDVNSLDLLKKKKKTWKINKKPRIYKD